MIAVATTFLGPTNHRGARVSARTPTKRAMIPWRYELDVEANHALAASALADRLGLGSMVGRAMSPIPSAAFVYFFTGRAS